MSGVEALQAELNGKDGKGAELKSEVGYIIYAIGRGVGVDFENHLRVRF